MSLDDATGIEDNAKQRDLNSILFNINQMYEYGQETDSVTLELEDVSLQDIDRYLKKIESDQDTSIKLFTVNFKGIYSPIEVPTLLDESFINPTEYPGYQKVYFIEGGEFALTLIPIWRRDNKVCTVIQPLEKSLPFIKREYYKAIGKRDDQRKTIEQLKKEISFVKFPKQK